ncbi:MAG: 4-(cytidine 5'-diphospho)-2-C-methyl-D-erythritol kinase [Clostridia bacterium]|nr:4-(cytidine 5'-diphospho)-2-C-methyl-D-erythritol kinase [Clostridia bacterium]
MKLKAYAKLNLTLDVCGKREDGYHLLDSVFQSIDLADTLTVEPANNIQVFCDDKSLCNENNICYQAAQNFFEATGIAGGVSVTIEKKIPQAAGMGGGSADAAAVILALDRLYETRLDNESLIKIGVKVGADVPFCMIGGTAKVGGIGEDIKPLRSMPDCYIVGFKDGLKASTGEMYRHIDECNYSFAQTQNAVSALANCDLRALAHSLSNDFMMVTDHADAVNELISCGALGATLSGSGPTVFGIFNILDDANRAFRHFAEAGKDPFLAHPVNFGVWFE